MKEKYLELLDVRITKLNIKTYIDGRPHFLVGICGLDQKIKDATIGYTGYLCGRITRFYILTKLLSCNTVSEKL